MFEPLEHEKKRRGGVVVGSIALHGALVAGVALVPLLGVADEVLPPRLQPLACMTCVDPPPIPVVLGDPDAGGNGGKKRPEKKNEPKPEPPPPEPIPAAIPVPELEPRVDEDEPLAAPSDFDHDSAAFPPGGDESDGDGTGLGEGDEPGIQGSPIGVPGGLPVDGVFEVHNVAIEKPVLEARVDPSYPPLPRRLGIEGRAILRAVIGADGSVGEIEIVSASHPDFGQAALAAVAKWRYRPGRLGDRPVKVRVTVVVEFRLSR